LQVAASTAVTFLYETQEKNKDTADRGSHEGMFLTSYVLAGSQVGQKPADVHSTFFAS
jgi:hypothetical protein